MLALTDYIKILISLVVVLDPIGAVPVFLAMTPEHTHSQRKRTVNIAALATAVVLIIAAVAGDFVLQMFGIGIAAFRVGGGIVILLMAISMLHARVSGTVQTPDEAKEAKDKDDVAVVPLAIPLLAGPGAISTVIIVAHRGEGAAHLGIVCGLILIVAALTWLSLRLGAVIQPTLGRTGINVVTRLMGLLLAAVAVEIVARGLTELFPFLAGSRAG